MGVPWPDPRFTDRGDGTVKDNLTGLIWLKDANCFGKQTWPDAFNYSNSLRHGICGLSDDSIARDWRLPNINELLSLMDYSVNAPAMPVGHPFNNVQEFYYWSSTMSGGEGTVWYVYFGGGVNTLPQISTTIIYLWYVRGGN
jgi:hypothetical protein